MNIVFLLLAGTGLLPTVSSPIEVSVVHVALLDVCALGQGEAGVTDHTYHQAPVSLKVIQLWFLY